MTEEQIKQKAEDYIITRQKHIKYFSGEAVKILLKNFGEEIVAEATKELQKENAELKESNKMLEQGYVWHDYDAGEDCYEDSHEGKWVKRDEVYQLTKAKELLKDITSSYGSTEVSEAQLYLKIKKAEQFLNSEVEK